MIFLGYYVNSVQNYSDVNLLIMLIPILELLISCVNPQKYPHFAHLISIYEQFYLSKSFVFGVTILQFHIFIKFATITTVTIVLLKFF